MAWCHGDFLETRAARSRSWNVPISIGHWRAVPSSRRMPANDCSACSGEVDTGSPAGTCASQRFPGYVPIKPDRDVPDGRTLMSIAPLRRADPVAPASAVPTASDLLAPDCRGMNFLAIDPRPAAAACRLSRSGSALPPRAAFRPARRARRRPPRRARDDRRQAPAGAPSARPLRARRGLDRVPPGLPRDGGDRLR